MARPKKTAIKVPAKAGRPPKYRAGYARQALMLAKLGLTDVQMADVFEVAPSTLSLWKRNEPEFSEAIRAGKDEADAIVAHSLYRRAVGYKRKTEKVFQFQGRIVRGATHDYFPPDVTACIFWLKNRQPALWRDAGRGAGGGEGRPGEAAPGLTICIDADTLACAGVRPPTATALPARN